MTFSNKTLAQSFLEEQTTKGHTGYVMWSPKGWFVRHWPV